MQRKDTQRTESALGKAIAEKRRLLYERHGGIMSPVDVAREMGYCSRASIGDRWARSTMFQRSEWARENGVTKQILWLRQSYRAAGWYKDAPTRGCTREMETRRMICYQLFQHLW